MTSSGIDFTELAEVPAGLINVEGCLKANERVLLTSQARRHFAERLDGDIVLGHRVASIEEDTGAIRVDGERFDFVIDATWGHYRRPAIDFITVSTVLLHGEVLELVPGGHHG